MPSKSNNHDRIRGHADVPLTPRGFQQAQTLGDNFKKNGPLDAVLSADLQRNRDTAKAVAGDNPVLETHHLRDLDYGALTGMQSSKAIPTINKHISQTPDTALPGGESFNSYKDRLTNVYKLALQASKAYPDARIGLVINRRSIKTAESWLKNGSTDAKWDPGTATEKDEGLQPGDVFKIHGTEGSLGVKKVDTTKPMSPGVYLIRHGLTAWNGESYEPQSGSEGKDDGTPRTTRTA